MKLTIVGKRAVAAPPVPNSMISIAVNMEGATKWLNTGGFSFEPTHHNMRLFREVFPDAEVDDQRDEADRWSTMVQGGSSPGSQGGPTEKVTYTSRTQPYGAFQVRGTEACLAHDVGGLFMEQGTGKSKVAIDAAGTRWCNWEITGVLIIAFNGVHRQWIDEAIPDHLGEMVPRRAWAWNGKKMPEWLFQRDKLAFFSINFESVFRKEGRKAVEAFITMHGGRVLCIVDEGQRIANPDAKSTQEIYEIGRLCQFRLDLTGTPIPKDVTAIWSQFNYLDPRIIGHQYKTTFRAQYCQMHPKFRGVVVGSKNEVELYKIVAPYIFRATKEEELDLPPKVYDKVLFDLHPEQRKIYDEMKAKFIVELDSGRISSVKNGAIAVMRLYQITCGYLALDKEDPDEATEFMELPNPRLEVYKRVRKSRLGKAVTWCRFNKDIEQVMSTTNTGMAYYGATSDDDRATAKRRFSDPLDLGVTDFISNPAAGGTGVDGLQKTGRTAIYYSNSYNSVHRWQSEDRTHRIGMGETCTYIDLIARNTCDVSLHRNLKKKKELSDLMLDDIRLMLMEDETD